MPSRFPFFATSPKAMEDLLAAELNSFGAAAVKETRAGVMFEGTLETAYRACLWSRIASRILLPVKTFQAADVDELYAGIQSIPWGEHLSVESTLAVSLTATHSWLTHTHFGALKVKDAIVDQFRDRTGRRPSIDVLRPDLRVHVHLDQDTVAVNIDLSGASLHQRGYRGESVIAPLKENLAAALLLRVRWPDIARDGGPLVDPMCGSGTLPIEAALMAGDSAPGLERTTFGFLRWKGHNQKLWGNLLKEAQHRRESGFERLPQIVGYDADRRAVRIALAAVKRAGLGSRIRIEQRDLAKASAPAGDAVVPGLVAVNPPYGERLGETAALHPLYKCLGEVLIAQFSGWKAAVLTGNIELAKSIGLRAVRVNTLYNGSLECKLLQFEIRPERIFKNVPRRGTGPAGTAPASIAQPAPDGIAGTEMFANRLRKNLRHLEKWARREGIYCYRIYDADLPEYAVAIDRYEQWVYVQEYEAPRTVDPAKARERLEGVRLAIPEVLGIAPENMFFRIRKRQKGLSQYQKHDSRQNFQEVREDTFKFLVNFTDYLDTGLFLDHRLTRGLIRKLAQGKRFLNLFAYTGTATVYAADGGATATTTVDSSSTYISWARDNLVLNRCGGRRHTGIRADCIEWLRQEQQRFGLIFLDPPTFSNSRDRAHDFDLQRDHVELVRLCAEHLEHDGVLLFSNNFRRFRLDAEALKPLHIQDITQATMPEDFSRSPRIHQCWQITRT